MYQEVKQTRIFLYPNNEDPKAQMGRRERGINMVNRLILDYQRNWLIMHNVSLKRLDVLDLTTYEHIRTLDYKKEWNVEYIYKAFDIDEDKHCLLISVNYKWFVWDYINNVIIHEQPVNSKKLIGIKYSPNKEYICLTDDSKEEVWIYKSKTFQLVGHTDLNASYSHPVIWHPKAPYVAYARMEQGGSDVYLGVIVHEEDKVDFLFDRTKSIESNSYILSHVQFSDSGNYIIVMDAGLHVYTYPKLEQLFSLDNKMETHESWTSPQYPERFWRIPSVFIEHKGIEIYGVIKRTILYFATLSDNNGLFFTDLRKVTSGSNLKEDKPIDEKSTQHLDFVKKNNRIFYTSNDLGEVYEIDLGDEIEKAMQNLD